MARAEGVSSLLRQRCPLGCSLWTPWPLPGSRAASVFCLTGSSRRLAASSPTVGTKNRSGRGGRAWHSFSILSHLLRVLYVSGYKLFTDTCFTSIFSQSTACLFTFFQTAQVYNFDEGQSIHFLFLMDQFFYVVYHMYLWLTQRLKDFFKFS